MKTSGTNRTVAFPRRHPRRAITLIEALVVLAVIALLAGMLLPALMRPTRHRPGLQCLNNLKQIGIAFRLFAMDHNDCFPQRLSTNEGGTLELLAGATAHFRVLSNELATPKMLVCRESANTATTNFATLSATNISYFIGMDADETLPEMILAGDDNLTTNEVPIRSGLLTPTPSVLVEYGEARHPPGGNVVMSDGRAEQLTSARLGDYLRRPPNVTNRFLLP